MFNVTDLKILGSSILGNTSLILINTFADFGEAVKIAGHVLVTFATIYYMYKNQKRKK